MVLFISLAESSQSYATKKIIELNKGGNECNEKLDFFISGTTAVCSGLISSERFIKKT